MDATSLVLIAGMISLLIERVLARLRKSSCIGVNMEFDEEQR